MASFAALFRCAFLHLASGRATWPLLISALLLSSAFALDFDRLQQTLLSRFGTGASANFRDWRQTMHEAGKVAEAEKLRRINDYFNQHIQFEEDMVNWGQADYWATPLETLGSGRGDCEDYAIAKYFSLLSLGVPASKMRFVYVRALQGSPSGGRLQAHMVLAYYPNPGSDPLVLDNLIPDIRPASTRSDLAPVFSFNSEGVWQGTGNLAGKNNLSRWQDLHRRARAEGFE